MERNSPAAAASRKTAATAVCQPAGQLEQADLPPNATAESAAAAAGRHPAAGGHPAPVQANQPAHHPASPPDSDRTTSKSAAGLTVVSCAVASDKHLANPGQAAPSAVAPEPEPVSARKAAASSNDSAAGTITHNEAAADADGAEHPEFPKTSPDAVIAAAEFEINLCRKEKFRRPEWRNHCRILEVSEEKG